MKRIAVIAVILAVALSATAFAVVGKTPVAFTDSDYAKGLDLKVNMQKPDLLAYVGKGKELVILKTKKEVVWYERMTWLSKSMPSDPTVIQQAFVAFLSQAVEIPPGTPEYDQLSQVVTGNSGEFMLKTRFVVKITNEQGNGGVKHFIEVWEKSLQ